MTVIASLVLIRATNNMALKVAQNTWLSLYFPVCGEGGCISVIFLLLINLGSEFYSHEHHMLACFLLASFTDLVISHWQINSVYVAAIIQREH